jgi:hypothetical protein
MHDTNFAYFFFPFSVCLYEFFGGTFLARVSGSISFHLLPLSFIIVCLSCLV